MKADLHIHTQYSDGSDSIASVAAMAKAMGLDAIAITDHDTPSHLNQLPLVAGLRVVGGVEISAVHRRTNTIAHVLGYRIQEPGFVSTLTQPLLEARNATSEKQADILIRAGYRIDMDRIGRADGKYLYKQHILDWLVTTGQVADMYGAFYQKTFKNGGICDFSTAYNDVFEAVEAIKKAGGWQIFVQTAHYGLACHHRASCRHVWRFLSKDLQKRRDLRFSYSLQRCV